MFQAAKANKELSQILLNTNPSFNLDIGEHNLHKFLAPTRHISMEDVSVILYCIVYNTVQYNTIVLSYYALHHNSINKMWMSIFYKFLIG